MARNPNHSASATWVDASDETSTISFNIPEYSVVTFAAVLSEIGEVWDAVAAISLMNKTQDNISVYSTKFSKVIPTDPNSQRERKMLIQFEDATNFTPGRLEIPAPDFTVVPLLPGTDIFDLTDTEMATLVAALEAVVRSQDGNLINVIRATAVGRNL